MHLSLPEITLPIPLMLGKEMLLAIPLMLGKEMLLDGLYCLSFDIVKRSIAQILLPFLNRVDSYTKCSLLYQFEMLILEGKFFFNGI